MAELARPADRSAEQVVADLTDPASGVLAPLTGTDIERLELNMQAYRIKAGSDKTDFGSTAEYVSASSAGTRSTSDASSSAT